MQSKNFSTANRAATSPASDNVQVLDPRAWLRGVDCGSGSAKCVLLTLWLHSNEFGESWPSTSTLARETGYSRRTVCAALATLERLRLIQRQRRRREGTRKFQSTRYRLLMPGALPATSAPEPCANTAQGPCANIAQKDTNSTAAQKEEDRAASGRAHHHPHRADATSTATVPEQDPQERPQNVPADPNSTEQAYKSYESVAAAVGLAGPPPLSAGLREHLAAAVASVGGIEGWHKMLGEIKKTPFLCGQEGDGWAVSLNWLVRPGKAAKVANRKYRRFPTPEEQAAAKRAQRQARYQARLKAAALERARKNRNDFLQHLTMPLLDPGEDAEAHAWQRKGMTHQQLANAYGLPVGEVEARLAAESARCQAIWDALNSSPDRPAAIAVQRQWTSRQAAAQLNVPEDEIARRMAQESGRQPSLIRAPLPPISRKRVVKEGR